MNIMWFKLTGSLVWRLRSWSLEPDNREDDSYLRACKKGCTEMKSKSKQIYGNNIFYFCLLFLLFWLLLFLFYESEYHMSCCISPLQISLIHPEAREAATKATATSREQKPKGRFSKINFADAVHIHIHMYVYIIHFIHSVNKQMYIYIYVYTYNYFCSY